jgi:hypothetical protein
MLFSLSLVPAGEDPLARDFVPEETLLCAEVSDLVRVLELGVDKVEQASHAPGGLQPMILMGLQAFLQTPGAATFGDLAKAVGYDSSRPGILGLTTTVDEALVGATNSPAGMLYLIIPVTNRQFAEKIIVSQLLPQFYRMSFQRCQALRNKVMWSRTFRRLQAKKAEAKAFEDLLFEDAYFRMRCPCGGKFAYSAEKKNYLCSAHEENPDQGDFRELLAAGLPETEIGAFRFVGGVEQGFAYGVGGGYVVIAPDARVVKACLEAAAGKRARLKSDWPTTGLVRGSGDFKRLLPLLERELFSSFQYEMNGHTPALERLLALLQGINPLTFSLEEKDALLVLNAQIKLSASDTEKRLALVPPVASALAGKLPDNAPLVAWSNLLPEGTEIFTLLLASFEGGESVIAQYLPLLMGREATFAFTNADGNGFDGAPNMLFMIADGGQEHIRRALRLTPEVIAVLNDLRVQATLPDGKPAPYLSILPRENENMGWRRQLSFFTAETPDFFALTTLEDDLKKVLAATPKKDENFFHHPGFLALGKCPAAANFVGYADIPAVVQLVEESQAKNRLFRETENCHQRVRNLEKIFQEYQEKFGKAPERMTDLEKLDKMQKWQVTCEKGAEYVIENGKPVCPIHGTREQPKEVKPQPQPLRRDQAIAAGLFGKVRLEASVENGVLKLTVVQQTTPLKILPEERHDAPPPPRPATPQPPAAVEEVPADVF